MSATELYEQLADALAPDDAPTDEDIAVAATVPEGETNLPLERVQRFQVRNLGSADWAGRKIVEAQSRIDEVKAYRAQVIAALDGMVEREEARQQPKIEFFEHRLSDWLRREIEADTSNKPRVSRELPCGVTVKRTAPGKSLVVEDEDALVDFLTAEYPDLATAKWVYDKSKVKALVVKQGVALKGAHVETGEPGYKVTVGGGA